MNEPHPAPRVTVADVQPSTGRGGRSPLVIGLIVLLVLLLGAGGYFLTLDMRYAAKCRSAYDTLQEVQTLTQGVKDLPADPKSDAVKAYVAKLDDAEAKLGKLADEFASTHVSKKNEARNQALVAAIRQERTVLEDVEAVLQNGVGNLDMTAETGKVSAAAEKSAKQFDADLSDLQEKVGALSFDDVDFASVMDLSSLSDDVVDYLKRQIQGWIDKTMADAQKAAADAQKAAAKQKADANAKRQALHQKIGEWNAKSVDAANAAGQATYVATGLHYDSYENLMEFDGYLYNGTNQTLRGKVHVTYTVYVYKDGEVIETDDRSYDLHLRQPLAPHQKVQTEILNLAGPNTQNGYDDFYVECKGVSF